MECLCANCNNRWNISTYVSLNGVLYRSPNFKDGNRVACPKCLNTSISLVDKPWDGGMPSVGRFSMLSPEQKKHLLKQRSKKSPSMSEEEKTFRSNNGKF